MTTPAPRRRTTLVVVLAAVVATGLSVRYLGPVDLPYFFWKYAGSALWATMVYLLVAFVRSDAGIARVAAVATAISVVVEFSRLLEIPALDAFRVTTAGALTLGRVFSLWNPPAYAAGVALGAAIDAILRRRSLTSS